MIQKRLEAKAPKIELRATGGLFTSKFELHVPEDLFKGWEISERAPRIPAS